MEHCLPWAFDLGGSNCCDCDRQRLTVLPELFLPSQAGKQCDYSGMDSPEKCLDPEYFAEYPHPVHYSYNSRGFRDTEWPNDLSQVIWCVGDSFTVGLGAPAPHTWPAVLQRCTGRTCLNISMDGASNMWIARMVMAIVREFPSADIVIQWSFIHRRELDEQQALKNKFDSFYRSVRDPSWPQCNLQQFDQLPEEIKRELVDVHGWTTDIDSNDRATHYVYSDLSDDIKNTQRCMQAMPQQVIHSAVPRWTPKHVSIAGVIETKQIDRARDGFHYDIHTSSLLVEKIISALATHAIDPVL